MALYNVTRGPKYTLVRTESGAVVADNAVISDANYPPANAIAIAHRAKQITAFWDATGAAWPDALQLQILHRDGLVPGWIEGEKATVSPKELATFNINENSMVYLRVVSVNLRGGATVTALRAYVAVGPIV